MKINLRKFQIFIVIISFVIGLFGCASKNQKGTNKGFDSPKIIGKQSHIDASISRQFIKYSVKSGDTLWRISQQFGTTPDTLVRINRIPDVRNLAAGKVLYIPSTARMYNYDKSKLQKRNVQQNNVRAPQSTNSQQFAVYKSQNKRVYNRPASSRGFIWPIRKRVLSSYGSFNGGSKSTGIDIDATSNDDVLAAKDGRVIVVLNNRDGWGKVVVIGHDNGTHTWYAHNSKVFVNKGTNVKRGQVIAKAGNTGSAKRVKLHFKVFVNDKPVNPLNYLPN